MILIMFPIALIILHQRLSLVLRFSQVMEILFQIYPFQRGCYKNTFTRTFCFLLICIFISPSIGTREKLPANLDCENAVDNRKLVVLAYVTYSGVGKGSSLK